MTTPSINTTGASVTLFLEFDEQYHGVDGVGGGTRIIQLSIDNGASWFTLDSIQTDIGFPNPAVRTSYDISSYISAGSLKVRFRYLGSWEWWWAIDNVEIIRRRHAQHLQMRELQLPASVPFVRPILFTSLFPDLIFLQDYHISGRVHPTALPGRIFPAIQPWEFISHIHLLFITGVQSSAMAKALIQFLF